MISRTVRLLAGCAAACTLAMGTMAPVGLAQSQPVPAGTPEWLRARLDNRLDPRTRAAVERLIDSARAAGIPSEPLVTRALQGAAMRAGHDAIVRAVRHLAGRLTVARDALGPGSLPSELDAGAEALQAGVSADALEKLRKDRAGQPLAVALGVLADLIGRGVPTREATQSVLALTRVGTTDEQLVAFQRDVERDIGIGAPPAAAATLRADGLAFSRLRDAGGTTVPGGARPAGRTKQRP